MCLARQRQARKALGNNVLESVSTGRLAYQPPRRPKCAVRKQIAGRCAVGQLESLARPKKVHRVVADHVAATNGQDTDFLALSRARAPFATVDELMRVPAAGRSLGEPQRRTAWGVSLLVVMRLDNLDVERRERPRGLCHELRQHMNSDAHVGLPQDRDLFGRGIQVLQRLRRKPRGATDERKALCLRQCSDVTCGLGARKFDDDLRRRARDGACLGIDGNAELGDAGEFTSVAPHFVTPHGSDDAQAILGRQTHERAAHAARGPHDAKGGHSHARAS